MKEKIKENYIYYAIFVLFLLIGLFVPVGGDDWEISYWYNNENLFSLLCKSIYMWNTYNGRILNNFFDMFLGKYTVLWAFISAMIHTGTIYYLLKIFKLEKIKILPFCMLILFLMVSNNFRMEIQLHKIINISYTIPAFGIFFTIYLINKYIDTVSKSKIIYICMFLLGLFCSLWIENLTIAFLCTSILMLIIYYLKEKKINKYCLYAVLGSLVGSIILFTSPGFLNRYNSSTGGLSTIELIKNNMFSILHSITLEQKSIYLLYSVISLFTLSKNKKSKNISLKIYYSGLSLLLITSILLSEFGKHSIVVANVLSKFNHVFFSTNSIICIVLMLSIVLSIPVIIIKLFNKEQREKALILYFLSIVSVAPMVLAPGYRNYILCFYSLFIIIIMIFSTIKISKSKKDQRKVLLTVLAIIFCFRIESYHYILSKAYSVSKTRNEIIQQYKVKQIQGNNEDEYLILPMYDNNIWGNLNSNYYLNSIKNYYGLKNNTKILFDDNFLYQGITINKTELDKIYNVNIDLLSKDYYKYNLKIYNYKTSELVYDITQDTSNFEVNINDKGQYTFNITIISDTFGYIVKNELKEVE